MWDYSVSRLPRNCGCFLLPDLNHVWPVNNTYHLEDKHSRTWVISKPHGDSRRYADDLQRYTNERRVLPIHFDSNRFCNPCECSNPQLHSACPTTLDHHRAVSTTIGRSGLGVRRFQRDGE